MHYNLIRLVLWKCACWQYFEIDELNIHGFTLFLLEEPFFQKRFFYSSCSQKVFLPNRLYTQYQVLFHFWKLVWVSIYVEIKRCTSVISVSVQKHPSRDVLRKRHSENMQQVERRTPMEKCGFNKFALQL